MMTHEELLLEAQKLTGWQKHKFLLMVGSSIAVALFLVIIAMSVYNGSGAAQLDLSRPGYQSVRNEAAGVGQETGAFPASGALTPAALSEFRKLYDKRLDEMQAVEAFGGDVMGDRTLRLDSPGESSESPHATTTE